MQMAGAKSRTSWLTIAMHCFIIESAVALIVALLTVGSDSNGCRLGTLLSPLSSAARKLNRQEQSEDEQRGRVATEVARVSENQMLYRHALSLLALSTGSDRQLKIRVGMINC